jgi:hypothetical protein
MTRFVERLGSVLTAGVLLTVLGGNAVASTLEDAQATERRDDTATALPIYQTLAEKGDIGAEKWLAFFYEIGWVVKRDGSEAISIFKTI